MNTTIVLLLLVPLLVWRMYSRIKRLMVRQQSVLWRHWLVTILFPMLVLGFAAGAANYPLAVAGLLGGSALGASLGFWGLRLTRFEHTAAGLFFTPNARLGLTIAMLFIARVLYRLFAVYAASMGGGPKAAPQDMNSPITMLVFGLMAGYYACYGAGLLRWHRAQTAAALAAPQTPSDIAGADTVSE